jgi:hypothetical protein
LKVETKEDLLRELFALPKNSAMRKINELVKRARKAKVHAYIVSHIKNEMPMLFGKDSKQKEILANLRNIFLHLHNRYRLPVGDFPDIARFRDKLKDFDFNKFNKLNQKLIDTMDTVLSEDIPRLMVSHFFLNFQEAISSTSDV